MSKTFNKFGCFALLGAIVILGAGGAYLLVNLFGSKELTPLEGAKVVPQEAAITGFISTDSKLWSKLRQFGTPEAQKLINNNLNQWSQQTLADTGINYEKDLQPWLGSMMLAFLPSKTNPEESNILVIVGIKDKLKALDFSQKFKARKDQSIQETKYKDISLITVKNKDGKTFDAAVLNDKIVLSADRKTVEMAIDTYKGQPSFLSKPGAKEILTQKLNLNNNLARFYLPEDQNALNSPVHNSIKKLQKYAFYGSGVIGVGVDNQGLRFQALLEKNPNTVTTKLKPVKNKLLENLPGNTIAVINGEGLSNSWASFVTLSDKDTTLKPLLEQARQSTQSVNINLDQEIFSWMNGEFALSIVDSNQGILASYYGVGVAIILETNNRSTAENTFNKLKNLVAAFVSIEDKNIQGKKVSEWKTFGQDLLSYGWINDKSLLVTFSVPFTDFINIKSDNSLSKSNKFTTITNSLPKENLGYFYWDLAKTNVVVNKIMQSQGTPISPESNAILNSFEAIALTGTMPNKSTIEVDMLLGLKKIKSK